MLKKYNITTVSATITAFKPHHAKLNLNQNLPQMASLPLAPGVRNKGFTLIELMVGISLGVIVLGAILAVFIPTLMSWQVTTANSYFQDTEQIAQDVFDRAIRPSSSLACGTTNISNSISPDLIDNSAQNWAFSFDKTFSAYGADTSSAVLTTKFSAAFNAKLLQDSDTNNNVGDILVTLFPDTRQYRVLNHDITSSPQAINFKGGAAIQQGELYMIHDCEQPTIVRANFNNNSKLTFDSVIINSRAFLENTVVSGYEPTVYYLGTQNNTPALFTHSLQKSGNRVTPRAYGEPLLIGVENMRLIYGVAPTLADGTPFSKDNNTDFCCTTQQLAQKISGGSNITDADIASIQIVLMMQTPQNIASNKQKTLNFPGLDGNNYNCFAANTTYTNSNNACPTLSNNSKIHKVVSFLYDMPGAG